MARYKHYNYDQMMMVPVLLEEQLMPGTLEYAIHHVVEERLDLSFFDERYRNDETVKKNKGQVSTFNIYLDLFCQMLRHDPIISFKKPRG